MSNLFSKEQRTDDPFAEAWRSRDLDQLVSALAPDVTLHSPLLSTPFHGRQVARDLYSVLFSAFGRMEIVDRSRTGDTEIVVWRGELRGRVVEGVDVLRHRPQGDIGEMRVLMRPLAAIGLFASVTGPPFARRRGVLPWALTWILTQPLGALFRILDGVAPRLLPLKSRRDEPGLTRS